MGDLVLADKAANSVALSVTLTANIVLARERIVFVAHSNRCRSIKTALNLLLACLFIQGLKEAKELNQLVSPRRKVAQTNQSDYNFVDETV